MNENGEWGNKRRRAYALDEDGNRIRDENGDYVFTGEYVTDWDSPETLEQWRQAWAEYNNKLFEEKKLPCRIDNRSFERQGIDQVPTITEPYSEERRAAAKGNAKELRLTHGLNQRKNKNL